MQQDPVPTASAVAILLVLVGYLKGVFLGLFECASAAEEDIKDLDSSH
jgi:hypothetical protein